MDPTIPFAGTATPLRASDLEAASRALAVDIPTIEAVLTVETGGSGGFLSDGSGRPRILFEPHKFGAATGGRYTASHPDISSAAWRPGVYLGGAAEYGRLARAVALDRPAALSSASWGLFQILGSNFKSAGFTNVEAYVAAMATGEGAQLLAFIAYCKAENLARALREKNWAGFASRYNGPSYAINKYDVKLAQAYAAAAARRLPPTEIPPVPAVGDGGAAITLRIGDRGALVQRVQRALRGREAQLSIDGMFGRATEAAVQRAQIAEGLTPDGIVGPMTWAAIAALERPTAPLA